MITASMQPASTAYSHAAAARGALGANVGANVSANVGAHDGANDGAVMARWLAQTLDHVGRGMLLLAAGARVVHVNRLARHALDAAHPLCIEDGRLRARAAADQVRWVEVLDGVMHRGLRHMLSLGEGQGRATLAVLPIDVGGDAALVSLSRPCRSHDLAVHGWARQHNLTSAELAVLEGLLAGEQPVAIARAKGVALSTVRTQIGQLRLKTGAHSIRELLDFVGALPPMMAVVQ